jgi:uncharacterized DUF497 family protein
MAVDLSGVQGFDWDNGNSGKNLSKHNVSDGECEEIFFNSPLTTVDDDRHSDVESRFAAYGVTNGGRLLMVVFTFRIDLLRIISARDMNRKEREDFRNHEENT